MADRQAQIDGLRKLADFLESHPDLPSVYASPFNIWTYSKEAFQAAIRQTGGYLEKAALNNVFFVRRNFGGDVRLEINIGRDKLCEWKCPEGILQ